MTMGPSAIEVKDAVKVYSKASLKDKLLSPILKRAAGEVRALDGVSLTVKWGEVFGILGPNGAGKTTLMKILTTVINQTSGRASVAGFDTVEQSLEVRKRIGVLLEESERGFYWRLSVWDNLYFTAVIYEIENPAQKVEALVKAFGLEEHRDKWFQKLSRGEKQKVALARALISDAPILMLDEPTLGLDVKTSRTIRGWLRERFGSRDRTIIMCSHDMSLVEDTCERIAIMNKGKILSIGSPREIKSLISSGQRTKFELEVEPASDSLKKKIVDMGWEAIKEDGKMVLIAPSSNPREDDVRRIVVMASEVGQVRSFRELEPSLEETFLRLTEGGA